MLKQYEKNDTKSEKKDIPFLPIKHVVLLFYALSALTPSLDANCTRSIEESKAYFPTRYPIAVMHKPVTMANARRREKKSLLTSAKPILQTTPGGRVFRVYILSDERESFVPTKDVTIALERPSA